MKERRLYATQPRSRGAELADSAVLLGWTMNAWSRFARQKVERVFAPISPLTAPFGRCRATRMKRRVCTSAPQQQQQRQARPAVAAALSAIWEQGILPALHSLLQHGSDTSTPDTVRKPQRPRLDASYDFGHRSRIPHAWAPCGYQTRTLATLLPTCVYKLHRSRLTCMPCGEFVRDGLVTTLARCPAAHRSLD